MSRLGLIEDEISSLLLPDVAFASAGGDGTEPDMHCAAYRPNNTDARDAWEDVPSRMRRRRRWTCGGCSITAGSTAVSLLSFIVLFNILVS